MAHGTAHHHPADDAHRHGHHPAAHHHPRGNDTGDEALAGMLELDAEVMRGHFTALTDRLAALADGRPVRRILDLGSGPGTGTLALLERFPDAEIVAVDLSPQMLHRLRGRLAERGAADRVRTVEADLDAPWPDLDGPFDLVWTAAALHHLTDPAAALARMREALRPGGILAVIETDGVPDVLPQDGGLPDGLEDRCRKLIAERHTAQLPHLGADWSAPLTDAGFTIEAVEDLTADLQAPLPATAARYATALLQRLRDAVADRIAPADLAALDTLRENAPDRLTLRTTRTAHLTRRPPRP